MVHSSDHTRDPCPYNIVSDVGIGFAMGAIGGSIWHGVKGYINSPRGERYAGAVSAIKARAPISGGSFAVWSGLFNANDCLISDLRGKEDGWNAILAGASTGAILAARSGPKGMAISAVFGGLILAAFEGVGAVFAKVGAANYQPQPPPLPEDAKEQIRKQQQLLKQQNAQQQAAAAASNSPDAAAAAQDSPAASPLPLQAGGLFKGRFGMA